MLGHQSQYLSDLTERDRAIEESRARVEQDPDLVAEAWTLYTLVPVSVEFWQADKSRVHTRLTYERTAADAAWQQHLLWP